MDIVKKIHELHYEICGKRYEPSFHDPDRDTARELERIRQHSPIPLPEDYCKIFMEFSSYPIELQNDNCTFMPPIAFWDWDSIEDIMLVMETPEEKFWKLHPDTIPFGTDMGGMTYLYQDNGEETALYFTDTPNLMYDDWWTKVACSFTELFTSPRAQRRFQHMSSRGYDYDAAEWKMLFSAYKKEGEPLPNVLQKYADVVPADILTVANALVVEHWLKSPFDKSPKEDTPLYLADKVPQIVKAALMEMAYNLHPDKLDYDKLEYHGEYDEDDDDE